jgi:hypothetical protein
MELAAVFLLSLLGGYAFALIWRYTAFATRRADGQHLYFRAAYYGAVLFVAAFLLRVIFVTKISSYKDLERPLLEYITAALKDPSKPRQAEIVVIAVYSMLLGPLLGLLANVLTPSQWSIRRNLNGLDFLLLRGQSRNMPVSLTLTNSKIYIGLVVRITDPERPPAMVTLLPMYSGHRIDDGRMELTTDYEKVYANFVNPTLVSSGQPPWDQQLDNFHIAIRADTIVTATLFSPRMYSHFNPGWESSIGKPKKSSPQEMLVEIKRRTPSLPAAPRDDGSG